MITRWTLPRHWLLSADERGNPHTDAARLDGRATSPSRWCTAATYFDRLVDEVRALNAGDHLFFTDWRGDPDEQLREDGPTVAELFTEAVKRGVVRPRAGLALAHGSSCR